MLSPKGKTENLAGKLLLSSALVAASLAYGWWQTRNAGLAMAPMPLASSRPAPVPHRPVTAPTQPVTEDAASGDAPRPVAAAPQPQRSAAIAGPQTVAPSATQAAPEPRRNTESPSPPSSPVPQQATESVAPPPPVAAAEPAAPVPAGLHLADGDFISDRHGLMWGDVRVKVSIHGGQITGVETLEFPDHRAQSAYLSQLALPILQSEVIKSQKAQVDVVSSATDTSYTFQDAVADAITKATRE